MLKRGKVFHIFSCLALTVQTWQSVKKIGHLRRFWVPRLFNLAFEFLFLIKLKCFVHKKNLSNKKIFIMFCFKTNFWSHYLPSKEGQLKKINHIYLLPNTADSKFNH